MNASATITTEFEDSFRSISNPNPQPMILTGLDGVVIVANPAARFRNASTPGPNRSAMRAVSAIPPAWRICSARGWRRF
jgi:hypothetical protein